jgi:CRISPR-associated protein Csb2
MSTRLCISIHVLGGEIHSRRDNAEPEWPPSPLRVFQALVAACAARWQEPVRVETAASLLRWLERLPPPEIIAPTARIASSPYRLSVPNNAMDIVARAWSRGNYSNSGDANPATHRSMKTVRPIRLQGDATMHYLWALRESDLQFEAVKELLYAAAKSVTHLGWGLDMVAANATVLAHEDATALAGDHWLPAVGGSGVPLRVPMQGTFDDLTRKHEAFLHRVTQDARGQESLRTVAPLMAFRSMNYRRATDPPTRPYAAFAFYRPDENKMRPFSAVRAVAVAGMVRCLAGKMARQTGYHAPGAEPQKWINEYVMGHGESDDLRPRFSYLLLPTIRPPNVAGDIRRVIIAEEPGGSGDHAAWAARTLRGQILISEQQCEEALLIALTAGDTVLRRYVDPCEVWDTVTPLVLPGCDGGKFAKAEKLFARALRHAGYCPESLANFELRKVSFCPGGELPLRYQRPEYLQNRSIYHARVRWRQPIAGPIAIGAGRHCGLGVFAGAQSGRGFER